MKIYRKDIHFGREVPVFDTQDFADKSVTVEKLGDDVVDLISNKPGKIVISGNITIGENGNWYCDGSDTGIKASGEDGETPTVEISDDGYWVINGVKTDKKAVGKDGKDGKDGVSPILKLSDDGRNVLESTDGGKTWHIFTKSTQLFIKGYVATINELPKNALYGDIYSVGPTYAEDDTEQEKPLYSLYVNTVISWSKTTDITLKYYNEGELPTLAENNTYALVKAAVDDYRVFKFDGAKWNMLANVGEIYASSDDIVNKGDNVYALVQSATAGVYELWRRNVGWQYIGTYNSIQAGIVQTLDDAQEITVPSTKAVNDALTDPSLKKLRTSVVYEEAEDRYQDAINAETARTKNSSGKGLDIADQRGNIILRVDEHIKTKEFDSSKVYTSDTVDEKFEEVRTELAETIVQETGDAEDKVMSQKASTENFPNIKENNNDALNIADGEGNVILEINNHIKTKDFDSRNAVTIEEFQEEVSERKEEDSKRPYVIDSYDISGKGIQIIDEYGNVMLWFKKGYVFENDIPCCINCGGDYLLIADENGYVALAIDKNGIINKTLNNNTSDNTINISDTAYADLCIADDSGNIIFAISNGTPKTNNFDGEDVLTRLSNIEEGSGLDNSVISIGKKSDIHSGANTSTISGGKYIGYKNPFTKDCVINHLNISLENISESLIGKEFTVIIGTIDQRNWLLPRLTFKGSVSNVEGDVATIDFSSQSIIAKSGEVLFVYVDSEHTVLVSSISYDSSNNLTYTSDIMSEVTYNYSVGCSMWELSVTDYKSIFATKESLSETNDVVETIQKKANNINIYKDTATGKRYEIKVTNGSIVLSPIDIERLLVIGHSFVAYGNSPSVDWYLDDGENRAMAASINTHQWTSFVANKIGASLTTKSGVSFERGYSTNFDFASEWNVSDNYDAICVCLQENAAYNNTMQSSWEAMLRYLKTAAPSAKIYCTASWSSNNKYAAIKAACQNVDGIVFVDCLGLRIDTTNDATTWHKGDYYYGRSDSAVLSGSRYHPMGAAYAHPNDMGHLAIANKFLGAMGYDEIYSIVHTITLSQSNGGTIETVNTSWPENGIVTIRVTPNDGRTINSVSVVDSNGTFIETTKRTNSYYDGTERVYYTFTMPNTDVIVTPIWN